jgi:DNA polymerase eta
VPVQQTLIERYPELAVPSPNEMDSPLPPPPQSLSWHPSCALVPGAEEDDNGTSNPPEANENKSPEETETKMPKQLVTWQDVALSIGAELLFKARDEILRNLGYTTSAVSMRRSE